jgi:hypothetical protein
LEKIMKIILSILLYTIYLSAFGCTAYNLHKDSKRENQKSNLITILSLTDKNAPTADCIYCDNTRAMNGNCTCFSSIPVGSCIGMNSGQGKSNSYKISCNDLESVGVWVKLNNSTVTCHYSGCPIEAYRSAFTADGR